ncbi:hypothetical protein HC752_12375 [Vibrio sp. S9_S30]|uniref:hypothetical protein n=1 Tax=Vibrio sp. S9_S30 TaxID=2720226 RepID=UPI00168000A8|nr:hypothetical protein [Vibrio sp. S9_S30]MBD1557729.1 hypothetical protein [Vibrio sp. S9_S30]
MKRYFLLAICLVLTACASPYSPPEMSETTTFEGLSTNGAQTMTYRTMTYRTIVVMVHGMCDKSSNWAKEPIESMVKKAGYNGPIVQNDLGYYFPDDGTSQGFPYLREYKVSDDQSELKFYAYHYSEWNRIRHSEELEIQGKAAFLNKKLKDSLVSGCLSDVTTYAGSKGIKIREYLAKSMQKVQDLNPESDTIKNRIFFISSSLGSKVLRDVLMCTPHPNQRSGYAKNQSTTKSLIARSSTVFMTSNQIPLLSPVNNCMPLDNNKDNATEQDGLRSNSLVAAVLESVGREQKEQKNLQKMNVVAYTDPSDLLSYPVNDYGNGNATVNNPNSGEGRVTVHNVKVSNTSTWFGIVTNMYKTHTGYFSNPDIIESIVCGSNGCQ